MPLLIVFVERQSYALRSFGYRTGVFCRELSKQSQALITMRYPVQIIALRRSL